MNWMDAQLAHRTRTNEAIAQAYIDADYYGAGWLKVDHMGSVTRVDPKKIVIKIIQEKDDDQ